MSETRDLTKAERLWIARLKRTLRAMPPNIELVAYDRRVSICDKGALRAFLDQNIGWGTAEDFEAIPHQRIHTHGECI